MSLLSALNANDLMAAAAKDLQPVLDKLAGEAADDEQKALAALAVQVTAALQTLNTIAANFDATISKLFDGYTVTITIAKKADTPS